MKVAVPALLLALLSGCVSDTVWYQEGARPAVVNDAATDCAVEAVNRVPQNTQLGMTPVYTTPAQTYCTSGGFGSVNCTTYGGDVRGGDIYSYDANTGLRQQVMAQCMARRGYQLISLPVCAPEKVRNVEVDQSRLPKLTENSCLVQTSTGYAMVNPR